MKSLGGGKPGEEEEEEEDPADAKVNKEQVVYVHSTCTQYWGYADYN